MPADLIIVLLLHIGLCQFKEAALKLKLFYYLRFLIYIEDDTE